MRGRPFAAGLAVLLGLGGAARAQAPAVNNGALDALKPTTPAPRTQQPTPRAPKPNPPAPGPQAARPIPTPPVPPPPKPPPVVPTAPPEIAAIPPAVAVPVQRPPEPPPVPVAADAPGDATPLPPDGLRTTFGPGRSELNAATEAAIRGFARPLRDTAQPVQVTAFAAGTPEDPSTPRRLSLARALAARAVLINEGIASTRIYVRALGAATGDGPADRVDLSAAPAAATPVAAAPTAGPPVAKP